MSTSLLYHAFGVRGYRYLRTEYGGGMVLFHIEPADKMVCCSECGSYDVIHRGSKERWFRSVPIGTRLTWLIATLPRVECRDCHVVRQIKLGFAEPRRTVTKAWARYALELSRKMTIKDVAEALCVTWDVVKEIKKAYLRKHFSKPSLKDVRHLAIDEICIGKGHRYVTLVLDLETGAVLFVGEGKSADSLVPFWRRLKRSRARIEAVAIDMSAAYIHAVETHLPNAAIVFDHFHVVKLMNEKLTRLRRDLYREATEQLGKDVLKGTRWLLLKNPENLNEDKDEPARLEEALAMNAPLATAYYLKEDLRQFWEQPTKAEARRFLDAWYDRAMSTGIKQLVTMARTLAAHVFGLLSYYDHPISTGPLEGTNNKIKTLQKQSYGIRDQEYFKLSIYALHRMKYALVG
jgi:transposase